MKRRLFFGMLGTATILPFFALPLLSFTEPAVMLSITALAIAISHGHVGTTAMCYIDRDYRPIIAAKPWPLIWGLLIAPLVVLGLFLATPVTALIAFTSFVLWQTYHYQRQNYGLAALAGAANRIAMPPGLSRAMILAGIGGGLSQFRILPLFPTPVQDLATSLVWAIPYTMGLAYLVYAAALVQFAVVIARTPQIRRSPLVLLFATTGTFFMLPALLADNVLLTVWAAAVAHATQYIIMVAAVARRSAHTIVLPIATVGMVIAHYFLCILLLGTAWLWPLFFGLTVFHFLADAEFWRLRSPLTGALVRERLAYAFPIRNTA